MTEAWLHRRGKPTWHFTPSELDGGLCHTTRRGTFYVIDTAFPHKCTFRILMGTYSSDGMRIWTDVTQKLCVYSIEFSDGGVYTFPVRKR